MIHNILFLDTLYVFMHSNNENEPINVEILRNIVKYCCLRTHHCLRSDCINFTGEDHWGRVWQFVTEITEYLGKVLYHFKDEKVLSVNHSGGTFCGELSGRFPTLFSQVLNSLASPQYIWKRIYLLDFANCN